MDNNHEDDIWSRLRKSQDNTGASSTQKQPTPKPKPKKVNRKPASDSRQKRRTSAQPQRQSSSSKKTLQSEPKPLQNYKRATSGNRKPYISKKPTLIVVGVVAVTAIGFGVYRGMSPNDTSPSPQSLGISNQLQDGLQNTEPIEEVSFRPFYPEDFDDRGIVFTQQRRGDTEYVTYTDTLDGTNFTVTQQLVSEDLAQGGDQQVENLAQALPVPAESVLQVNDTKIYIGVSDQNRQALLFTKENILILISTEGLIDEASWVGYVSSLINKL